MSREYRNVIKTKKAIRGALVELIKEKQAIEKITVAELAERADIAKSTFYYHYADIYEVAEEFEDEFMAALDRALSEYEADERRDFTSYMDQVVLFIKEHEYEYRCVCSSSTVNLFLGKLKTILIKKFAEEAKKLMPQEEATVQLIKVHVFTNACVNTIVDYFQGTLEGSLDQVQQVIAEMVEQLFLNLNQ